MAVKKLLPPGDDAGDPDQPIPWDTYAKILIDKHGWTYEQIGQMTMAQIFFAIREGLPASWRKTTNMALADARIAAAQARRTEWVEEELRRSGR